MDSEQHTVQAGLGVELRHLQAFVTVAEEGSFTRAASRLALTQPALSRTVMQFERLVHCQLFDRSSHFVELTPAGRRALPFARRSLAAIEEAIAAAQNNTVLRVGFTWSAAGDKTALIFRAFEKAHPDTSVELRSYEDPLAGLADGRSHIAFLRGEPGDTRFATAPLFQEPRMAALHRDHPLAARSEVTLEDIADSALIVNVVSGTTTPDLWSSGSGTREIFEVHNLEEWLEAVAAGRGVGVTPASTSRLYPNPWISYLPIRNAPPIPVLLAWDRYNAHPLCADFVEVAQLYANESCEHEPVDGGLVSQ